MPPIPAFGVTGLLPPYVGTDPTNPASLSPYRVTTVEVASRLGASPERRAILLGLFEFRRDFLGLGLGPGFQWLDGSFVEDIDKVRPPNDVDIVTFFHLPPSLRDPSTQKKLMVDHPDLFNPVLAKAKYRCDPYFVTLDAPGEWIVANTRYWFGLFSHTREQEWKGMLEVPLPSLAEDATAINLLISRGSP